MFCAKLSFPPVYTGFVDELKVKGDDYSSSSSTGIIFVDHPESVMPVLKYEDIIRQLKAKEYAPVYFLTGDEPYFIDSISDFIEENVLTESEKAFNQVKLYGRDVDFKSVVDQVTQFPLMAEKRVVLLKEAQSMKDFDQLQGYFSKPATTSILVISYKHKKLDGRSAVAKVLDKNAVVLKASRIYDNQVPDWIKSYLSGQHIGIKEEATMLLSEYVGADLSKLSNELEKLTINVGPGATVTPEEIERYIGISKEYNIFELQKALAVKDGPRLARMAQYFRDNSKDHPPVMVIGSLYTYFSKVLLARTYANWTDKQLMGALKLNSPFFLREYRTAARNYSREKLDRVFYFLLEADKQAKGIDYPQIPDGEIIRDLIFKISYL